MGDTKYFKQSQSRIKGKQLKELCLLEADMKREFGDKMFNKGEGVMMSIRDRKEQEAGVGKERHQVMVLIWPLRKESREGAGGAKLLEANSPPAQTGTIDGKLINQVLPKWSGSRIPLPPHAQTLAGNFQASLKSWSKAEVMMSHCGFDLHFPEDQWCWAPFYVPVGHLYVCFGEGWLLSKSFNRQQALVRMWRKANSCALLWEQKVV